MSPRRITEIAMVTVLFWAVAACAQGAVNFTFAGQNSDANTSACNADGRCLYLDVFQGRSQGVTSAYLYYNMSWIYAGVAYSLTGYGEIPASTLQFTSSNKFALDVNTAGNGTGLPGFSGGLCAYDSTTFELLYCAAPYAHVTMTAVANGLFSFQNTSSSLNTFIDSSVHNSGTFNGNSATANVTVSPVVAVGPDQSFPNTSANIGTGQNETVSITHGR